MLFELLLYADLNCADADALMLRIQANEPKLSPKIVVELVETVKEATPECNWDAND